MRLLISFPPPFKLKQPRLLTNDRKETDRFGDGDGQELALDTPDILGDGGEGLLLIADKSRVIQGPCAGHVEPETIIFEG